jgi:enolase
MNRAAEDASGAVSSIFLDAIKNMSLQDGLSILKGNDFAATEFLKKNTTASLTEKMRPVIQASLDKVNASSYWKDVFTAYNRVSVQKVNPDLNAYVTSKAMEGIFHEIGLEEQKIRKNPAAQVTELLKKVFGK